MTRSLSLALLLAAGCTGNIAAEKPPGKDPSPTGSGGSGMNMNGGGSTGGPGPVNATCGAANTPRARTWRLTNTQFKNTAQAVFGFTGPSTDMLPPDGQPDGFANQSDRLGVSPLLASRYLAAADEIAASVVSRSGEFIKCPMASLGTGTCLSDFLTTVGARAWRRPLSPAELTRYSALYGKVAQGNTPEVAFKSVVQTLVLSPNFLFRTELGTGGAAGTTTALTDHELAAALSYMLTDGPPDATLAGLAASGKLHDPEMLAAQARRLLAGGPQAAKIVGSFFRQWLQFDALPELSKDATLFPTYTPELVSDLLGENQAMLDAVLFDPAGDHSVKTLLTANFGYVNSRTAPLYGVQATGNAFVKTMLPAKERRGLLTQAAFIAAISDADDTNLPARGRIVREQVLCESVPPPPGNFQFEDPKITPDMTNRERMITHTTNPACAVCHASFDGIGYALEQYDPIGRFRTTHKNKTIDSSGMLPLTDRTLTFSNYVDLIDQVTALPATYQCLAFQYDSFATGRAAAEIPQCERDAIAKAFAGAGYKLDALVSAIVSSPNFAMRRN
jgi:hypothetical protein